MRRLFVTSLLIAMPLSLAAQRGGFIHGPGHLSGSRGAGFHRGGYGRGGYYGFPVFDPLYSDYFPGYAAVPEPQVIVLQPPAAAVTEAAAAPVEPLMIELQGDRYVQISGDTQSASQTIDRIPPQAVVRSATTEPPQQRASTVLVFRDGRREEISDYTIADGVLYAVADYYTSGAWNRKLALWSLNLPETVAANRTRGVQFRIPTAPNEVIVGP